MLRELYSNNSIRLIDKTPNKVFDDIDANGVSIITDSTDLAVNMTQVYKDKDTLVTVMKHY